MNYSIKANESAYLTSVIHLFYTIIIITQYQSHHIYEFVMFDKALHPYRKRLNTEIVAKADIAFDAIKRYEVDQSRVVFNKRLKLNEKNLLNELDQDFSKFTPHKKIELDQVYNVSLLTYSQQFYCLQMINYVFPMRVYFTNVKNDGILYIGYDQEYPGIQQNNKLSIFQNDSYTSGRNYDLKQVICRDMLVTLKSKGNQIVQSIYFTISAGSSLLMFDFRVEFVGLTKNTRILSQPKFRNPMKVNYGKDEGKSQLLMNQYIQNLKSRQTKFPQLSRVNHQKLVKLEDFQVFTQNMAKKFSKASISPSKHTSRKTYFDNSRTVGLKQKSQSLHQLKRNNTKPLAGVVVKGEVDLKIEERKRNKQIYQIYKQKDKQLREISGKCKRLIENYQKVYNQQSVRKKKLNKDIALIIYSMLYVDNIHKRCKKEVKRQNMKYKVTYLCKKFIRKLKKKYDQTCKMQPYRYKRMMAQSVTGLSTQTQLIFKNSMARASKATRQFFMFLSPIISLNKSFIMSNIYRKKVILIQRAWKSKYNNRVYALLYFIDHHVEKMIKEYPYLKIFAEDFYNKRANREICLGYIKDESLKYRFIYDAYQRKLEEIDEIIEVNSKIQIQSPRNKSRIIVPKRPIRPMHRFFRNADILKSMIRGWFQIQNKKHSKKNLHKSHK